MNYDNWKLRESPSEEVPHPLSCVDKINHFVEFMHRRKAGESYIRTYVCGIVYDADNETVTIKSIGQPVVYYLDDLRPIED